MKINAICIKCGSRKKNFRTTCPNCGFKPNSHEDLVVSFRASVAYYDSEELSEKMSVDSFLAEVQGVIQAGEAFSESEIKRIDRKVKLMRRESNNVLFIGFTALVVGVLMIIATILMVKHISP